MPVAGWLYRYLDARFLVLFGIGILAWGYYDLAKLSIYVGYWNLVPVLLLLGAGMPFMFVTLTTVSLSTIPREDMTDASSLYTLTRLVGGNIGYALVATLVADFTQVHRSQLVQHISAYNPAYLSFHGGAAAALVQYGLSPPTARLTAHAVANAIVNQQAAMLAYNAASWWMGAMFLLIIPLTVLLPGRPHAEGPA
jgi:DHA2 family multidrug resistance protein